jgi:hypothetical protein
MQDVEWTYDTIMYRLCGIVLNHTYFVRSHISNVYVVLQIIQPVFCFS